MNVSQEVKATLIALDIVRIIQILKQTIGRRARRIIQRVAPTPEATEELRKEIEALKADRDELQSYQDDILDRLADAEDDIVNLDLRIDKLEVSIRDLRHAFDCLSSKEEPTEGEVSEEDDS